MQWFFRPLKLRWRWRFQRPKRRRPRGCSRTKSPLTHANYYCDAKKRKIWFFQTILPIWLIDDLFCWFKFELEGEINFEHFKADTFISANIVHYKNYTFRAFSVGVFLFESWGSLLQSVSLIWTQILVKEMRWVFHLLLK